MEQQNWEKKDNLEDVKIVLAKLLRRWYWIVGTLLMALSVAFLFNRYQAAIYVVQGSFISKKFNENQTGIIPGLSGMRFNDRIEVFEQIPLLKAEQRIYETLDKLDFGISYFVEGRLKTTELYDPSPFKVSFDDSSQYIPYNQKIYVETVNDRQFKLSSDQEVLNQKLSAQTYLFGVPQNMDGWQFSISNINPMNPEYTYFFIIHDPRGLMNRYRGRLNMSWAERGSAILNTSISSELPEKAYKFLKTYLQVIIDYSITEQQENLVKSIDFMNNYMVEVSDSIVNYQSKMDEFRLNNRDVINGSTLVIDKLKTLEDEKTNLLLEMSYYDYLKRYIEEHKLEEVFAPNLIGLDIQPLEELVQNYMQVKWEDQISKNEFNDKNPLVNKKNEEFERIEKNIYESIINLKELNTGKSQEIEKQINFYLRSIDDIQVDYRKYVGMERMASIYEELYNQLLERKTDASISMASIVPDYQIVTDAYYSSIPVYPDKDKSYLIALLVGLGLPVGLILLLDYINPRVISKEDLKRHTNIPVIGSVGHFNGKTNLVVSQSPKAPVSEAFRVIRANLEYIDSDNKGPRILLITSSISGEGKTFCSANLALTYAKMGKKTLLIGADMRKPAMSRDFKLESSHGLSNYLSGQDSIEDVIYASGIEDQLDVIPGGHVPPNPSELLTSKKMPELMDFVKNMYEVIVFDTPPIGLVSDTIELIKHSFTPLLIVRQGISYKKSLDAITEMYQSGKIKNLGIIMNDVQYYKYDYGSYYGQHYGYGSGSGYGYYDDEKKQGFWSRFSRS